MVWGSVKAAFGRARSCAIRSARSLPRYLVRPMALPLISTRFLALAELPRAPWWRRSQRPDCRVGGLPYRHVQIPDGIRSVALIDDPRLIATHRNGPDKGLESSRRGCPVGHRRACCRPLTRLRVGRRKVAVVARIISVVPCSRRRARQDLGRRYNVRRFRALVARQSHRAPLSIKRWN